MGVIEISFCQRVSIITVHLTYVLFHTTCLLNSFRMSTEFTSCALGSEIFISGVSQSSSVP